MIKKLFLGKKGEDDDKTQMQTVVVLILIGLTVLLVIGWLVFYGSKIFLGD